MEKILEKFGNLSVRKSGNPDILLRYQLRQRTFGVNNSAAMS